jgi:hypothetical protein
MENVMRTIPKVDGRPSGPPASPFATTDPVGRFLSRYWGVELTIGLLWIVVAAGIVALVNPVETFAPTGG